MNQQELIDKLIEVDGITSDLGKADLVICMSQVLKTACTNVGVPEEKARVLGNRVSTLRFEPLPQKDYNPQIIRALFIGRLQEQKNVHGIAWALNHLKADGWRVHLDVCGGAVMNDYLKRALSVLEPSEWRYWGPVPNRLLPRLFHTADMYVGPSLFEGFQIPLIEALACGKPCVASEQPPASEIVDGEVGALVDPTDPKAIARAIGQLKTRLNDPVERSSLTESCRRRAVECWDFQIISRREVALYLDLLELANPQS